MKLPTLYKMNSRGTIQQWDISLHCDDKGYYYQMVYGQQGGNMQVKDNYVLTGKNQGKANETSPKQQCESEARSKWSKQKDRKGYSEYVPTEKPLLPMKAKKFSSQGHKISFPCFGQRKLDGFRVLIHVKDGSSKLISRGNKEFKVLTQINNHFNTLDDGVYDGELYSDELTFQQISSAVKRDTPNDLTDKIKVVVYDFVSEDDYQDRFERIKDLNSPVSKVIENFEIKSEKDAKDYLKKFEEEGYEGLMLRNKKGPYKINGNSDNLQKFKSFIDEEFKLVDVTLSDKNEVVWVCENLDGKPFYDTVEETIQYVNPTPKGTTKERREYYENRKQLIGKKVTVRYAERTDKNVPRFPVGIAVREDWDLS